MHASASGTATCKGLGDARKAVRSRAIVGECGMGKVCRSRKREPVMRNADHLQLPGARRVTSVVLIRWL